MSDNGIDWGMELENLLMACDLTSWIDLANGLISHGRLHRFQWSDAPSGYEVERILRDRGIHAYGRMCMYYKATGSDGSPRKHLRRWCWVNATQANFAEYNLLGAGVPLENDAVNPANWRRFGQGAARPTWRRAGRVLQLTLLARIIDCLASIGR